MNNVTRIRYLVEQASAKLATAAELEELLLALKSDNYESVINEIQSAQEYADSPNASESLSEARLNEMATAILKSDTQLSKKSVPVKKPFYRIPVFKYAAAASLIIAIATFVFKTNTNRVTQGPVAVKVNTIKLEKNDFSPGRNVAVLQLDNGTVISLDSVKEGAIAKQGSATIFKNANGEIVYSPQKNITNEFLYNTMRTPRGGQYQLLLPDGSKVWLNAASSIRYPVSFNDKERKVTATGEAYFEVAHNAQKPFVVVTEDGMDIRVLGTHFNINTYKEESLKRTTLLEGSVQISKDKVSKILTPGQQAEFDSLGVLRIKDNANIESVIAWKNGLFNFNKADIKDVMNQLARWYDINIRYEGTIASQVYEGEMQRDLKLSQVLKLLERSGIHFKIENNTLLVMP